MRKERERWPPQGLPAGNQILSGTLAARPAAGTADTYYWATDITTMFRDTGAAWEVVGAQWYRRYIDTIFGKGRSSGQAVQAIGTVYYSPIIIERTVTIDRLGLACGLGGTGNYYQAIYDSVAEAPVNRLAVSASTAHAINEKIQVPIVPATLQLEAGYYFLAFVADNTADLFTWTYQNVSCRVPANINHGPSFYEEVVGAYAPPPVAATPVFSSVYAKVFWMWVRVVSIP